VLKISMKINNMAKRLQQLIIIVAHLVLLKWIFFVLYDGGTFSSTELLLHFTGMGVYGALLIRICAYLGKRQFDKELAHHDQHS